MSGDNNYAWMKAQRPVAYVAIDGSDRRPQMSSGGDGSRASQGSLAIGLRWPHLGLTAALNLAVYCVVTNRIPPGQWAYEQVGETCETLYGSDDGRGERANEVPGHGVPHPCQNPSG